MGKHWAFVTCSACGKRGYNSKRAAKREARANSLYGLSVYRCRTAPTELWHVGHLPKQVKDGRWDRGQIGPTAMREPKDKRRLPGE